MTTEQMIRGIYGLRNIFNNKWYIGQSINISKRKHDHFLRLKRGAHYSPYLQRAFSKYGENGFEFVILEKTTEGELNKSIPWSKARRESQKHDLKN